MAPSDHNAAPVSAGVDPTPGLLSELKHRFIDAWWESDTSMPPLGRTYTPREQAARERQLERLQAALNAEAKHPPRNPAERQATQERLLAAFYTCAQSGLDLEARHLDAMMASGFIETAGSFARVARRFDPAISGADIYQAGRNVWTMNFIQLLFGLPVRLTPAIFAYSMLYPYSDNYLDDQAIPPEAKLAFSERFQRRLAGEALVPANRHEQAICDLVSMIEGQFARPYYPQVFNSLLAIHRAQGKSLGQFRRRASPYEVDVLGISFEKGGASVLADGYLVAGALNREQVDLLFGLGAFTQMIDDLEDVHRDLQDGSLTVFSQTAQRWPLDGLSNRLLHFGAKLLAQMESCAAPGLTPFGELLSRGVNLLFIDLAGRAGRYYSRGYLREMEAHSPFRLSFLSRQRYKLERQRRPLSKLAEAYLAAGSEELAERELLHPAEQKRNHDPLERADEQES